jgi:uncharacterized protein (TIGR03083 family)
MQVNSVGETSTQWREAFRTAGHWFATTSRVAPDQLDQPALGVWNVRDLLGHTSRALSTVSTYLATEAAGGIGVESAVDYFRLALRQAAPEEVAERGRTAGAALGAEPAAAIAELLDEVTERLVHTPDDAPVTTPFGVMALAEYLPTRAFELTVHTCDLACALSEPLNPPAPAAASALRLAVALGTDKGAAGDLLLGLTGRRNVPAGFSVL